MNYAVEILSGSMLSISNFINVDAVIYKLIGVIHRHTDSMDIA
jgi:hypothetical protein